MSTQTQTYKMDERPTEKLIEIINSPDDYKPEAIKEAEQVLTARGVTFLHKEAEVSPLIYTASAALGMRLLEFIIDYTIIVILLIIIAPNDNISENLLQLIFIILFLLYYIILESTCGRTVGKMICGLEVVDMDGNKPTWKMIIIRSLCRFIPLDQLSWGCKSKYNRYAFWHDQISKSFVVSIKKLNQK